MNVHDKSSQMPEFSALLSALGFEACVEEMEQRAGMFVSVYRLKDEIIRNELLEERRQIIRNFQREFQGRLDAAAGQAIKSERADASSQGSGEEKEGSRAGNSPSHSNSNASSLSLSPSGRICISEALSELVCMGFTESESQMAVEFLRQRNHNSAAAAAAAADASDSLEFIPTLELERAVSWLMKQHSSEAANANDEILARRLEAVDLDAEAERRLTLALLDEETAKEMEKQLTIERKDQQIAAVLADEQIAKTIVEQTIRLGHKLPLAENNARLLALEAEMKVGTAGAVAVPTRFECCICLDHKDIGGIQVLEGCFHYYCVDCLRRYVETEMENGKVKFKCPEHKCDANLTINQLSYCLPKDKLDRLNSLLTNDFLVSNPNTRWCPKKGCNTPMLGDSDSRMMICPACKHQFCFTCKTDEWHTGKNKKH